MTEHHHAKDGLSCREILESLSPYIDGELDSALCEEIEQHLEGCERCQVVVNTLDRTVSLYEGWGREDIPLPADVEQNLYKRLNLQAFIRPKDKEQS
jgi:anti-sigma factor RsiW